MGVGVGVGVAVGVATGVGVGVGVLTAERTVGSVIGNNKLKPIKGKTSASSVAKTTFGFFKKENLNLI